MVRWRLTGSSGRRRVLGSHRIFEGAMAVGSRVVPLKMVGLGLELRTTVGMDSPFPTKL